MRWRGFVVSLGIAGCDPRVVETCPQGQVVEARAASSASAWVEVTAPRDVALLQATARVVLPGAHQAVIRPLYRAQIVGFRVQAGDRVKVGDPVVEVIMPEVVAAAASYRGAQLRGEVQAARRDKLKGLRDEGLVAEAAVFDVASRTAETEQQAGLAAATLRAAGLEPARGGMRSPRVQLRSPIDGVVRELGGQLGEVVEGQGAPVAVIVGEGPARVEARFLHAPPAGCAMRFVAIDGAVWPLQAEPVARVVEADDGASVLWFQPVEERRAFAGLRGAVECVSDDASLVQVPEAALGRVDGRLVVYRREREVVEAVGVELVMASGASALVRAVAGAELVAGMLVAEDARAVARGGGATGAAGVGG